MPELPVFFSLKLFSYEYDAIARIKGVPALLPEIQECSETPLLCGYSIIYL